MAYANNLTAHKADLYGLHGTFNYSDQNIAPILHLLDLQPGEHLLDLGCGDGVLTDRLASVVGAEGRIAGTDSNQGMLDKAEASFASLKGKVFQADAQALFGAWTTNGQEGKDQLPPKIEEYEHAFDAVFTNATLHWCKRDPAGVLDGVKRLLKKSSKDTTTKGKPRFVGEFGGFLNVTGVRSHLHRIMTEKGYDPVALDPWYFPSDEEYRELLESKGFTVEHISLNPRITHLKTDLYGWLETFARHSFLAGFEDEEAEKILMEVVKRAELDSRTMSNIGRKIEGSEGQWSVMYVRLRFVATIEQV